MKKIITAIALCSGFVLLSGCVERHYYKSHNYGSNGYYSTQSVPTPPAPFHVSPPPAPYYGGGSSGHIGANGYSSQTTG